MSLLESLIYFSIHFFGKNNSFSTIFCVRRYNDWLFILYNLHVLAKIINDYVNTTGIAHHKKFKNTAIRLYGIDKGTYDR